MDLQYRKGTGTQIRTCPFAWKTFTKPELEIFLDATENGMVKISQRMSEHMGMNTQDDVVEEISCGTPVHCIACLRECDLHEKFSMTLFSGEDTVYGCSVGGEVIFEYTAHGMAIDWSDVLNELATQLDVDTDRLDLAPGDEHSKTLTIKSDILYLWRHKLTPLHPTYALRFMSTIYDRDLLYWPNESNLLSGFAPWSFMCHACFTSWSEDDEFEQVQCDLVAFLRYMRHREDFMNSGASWRCYHCNSFPEAGLWQQWYPLSPLDMLANMKAPGFYTREMDHEYTRIMWAYKCPRCGGQ